MKVFAAALLAIAAQSISLRDGPTDAEIEAEIAKQMKRPMPQCPPPPSDEQIAAAVADPESVFDAVDQDGSGKVDADEAADALKCAVKAGLLSEDEAKEAFKGLAKAAGKDGKLSKDEAAKAVEGLELAQKEGG